MAASGPLRFRTPYIEEIHTAQQRQAPGFAWVAVTGPPADPAKNWGTINKKRKTASSAAPPSESQKEERSARQQREVERKIRDLNSDAPSSRDVPILWAKKEYGNHSSGGSKAGKTLNTKKILASGKTFAHFLDDEEAEIARTGRREGLVEVVPKAPQRASKTPLARRKPVALQQRDDSSSIPSSSPAPTAPPPSLPAPPPPLLPGESMDLDEAGNNGDDTPFAPLPSQAELEALLNAPPLTYNQARVAPPPQAYGPPPRKFCEICSYWGRVKCMKCGNMTCSVVCKDAHDEHKCLKFYA